MKDFDEIYFAKQRIKWKIDISKLKDGIYEGGIEAPKDITEFRGFKEELGLDINEIDGRLSFYGSRKLKSIRVLPQRICGFLNIDGCKTLTNITKMPNVIKYGIYKNDCPFFEGMDEEQIREKYGIRK